MCYAARMSALAATPPLLSYAEYLELERSTDIRHEFLRGEAWAMAGGTPRHSAIKSNLLFAVALTLRSGPCRVYDSDLKVRIPETGLATYPDLSLICGPLLRDGEDPNAATNPTVLFEVLSPSREAWDRGGKFHHYQRLPGLRQYVLIGDDPPLVEVFSRGTDGGWLLRSYRPGERFELDLTEGRVELSVDELYRELPEG